MSVIHDLWNSFWRATSWSTTTTTTVYIGVEEEYFVTDFSDLYLYPVPIAASLFIFRYALEKYGFCRLGSSIGLKNIKNKKALPNAVLEKAFKRSNKWSYKDIVGLAKRTNSTERQIERWLRLRKIQDKPSPLHKFSEICWCSFYFSNMFVYGLIILWSKPWLWNLDHCWANHPYQGFTSDVWWYYTISLSFYWSLITSQIFHPRQRDFWRILIYNFIAVFLLSFFWICNAYRIGTILLLFHDATDAFFYIGKVFRYLKCHRACTTSFIVFLILLIVTKLVYFPFWILHSTIYRAPVVAVKLLPIFSVFKGTLIGLFLLDLYWMYSILRIVDGKLKFSGKDNLIT